jgi:signal transduction histidine kinase
MPEIPIAGFLLEALGAAALALMLSSFERKQPRAGLRDWSLGLRFLAAALLASVAVSRVSRSPRLASLQLPLLALAVVFAYWAPALVLLGTWKRWNGREAAGVRRKLLGGLAALGVVTTLAAPWAGPWGFLVRSGTRGLLTLAAHLFAGLKLLRSRGSRPAFGCRVLALSFLGLAAEDALFLVSMTAGASPAPWLPSAGELVELELLLLMLTGVGMIAWLLEEERETAVNLQLELQRREALSAMGALVAGVAHEVRNPLFGISASLDAFAARFGSDGPNAGYVATMREQVGRLGQLMKELLDYGRPIAAELTRVSLSGVATTAVAACDELAERSGVSVELVCAPVADAVLGDETRLVQVLQNLVQNAIQHSPRGGRVWLEVRSERREQKPGACCTVRDSGPGFDPIQLPRVFEPFFSRRRGGTGLGLSIVHRIVEQHEGLVEAANHAEGGAVVSVWLPAAPRTSPT